MDKNGVFVFIRQKQNSVSHFLKGTPSQKYLYTIFANKLTKMSFQKVVFA